jgi:hypothetical protein
MSDIEPYLAPLVALLPAYDIYVVTEDKVVVFRHAECSVSFYIAGEPGETPSRTDLPLLFSGQLHNEPVKVLGMLLSKLKLNRRIFARHCSYGKVAKKEAEVFLRQYHLQGPTASGFNRGLFYKGELLAIASFSKGRKMKRLPPGERSFELIRFCCKTGISVSGGLSKLVKNFCLEKKAGDVMTYVDKHLHEDKAFERAGFRFHSESQPSSFVVERSTLKRSPYNVTEKYDWQRFYLVPDQVNVKMVFRPE